MRFTRQAALHRFGRRWGCYATCLINVVEMEIGRAFTRAELDRAVGALFFADEAIALANYKDHDRLGHEMAGWSASVDKEWHFLVLDQKKVLEVLAEIFGLRRLRHDYVIHEWQTRFGSHFVLVIDGIETVNPDPALSGRTVEVRPVEL